MLPISSTVPTTPEILKYIQNTHNVQHTTTYYYMSLASTIYTTSKVSTIKTVTHVPHAIYAITEKYNR
jgi:hypothetical protein